jgi:hypothetical protein
MKYELMKVTCRKCNRDVAGLTPTASITTTLDRYAHLLPASDHNSTRP